MRQNRFPQRTIPVQVSASPGSRSMSYALGFVAEALGEWR